MKHHSNNISSIRNVIAWNLSVARTAMMTSANIQPSLCKSWQQLTIVLRQPFKCSHQTVLPGQVEVLPLVGLAADLTEVVLETFQSRRKDLNRGPRFFNLFCHKNMVIKSSKYRANNNLWYQLNLH